MAFALLEAGCRAVYCVDLPESPGEDFQAAREYANKLRNKTGQGRLEYMAADVTDQVGSNQQNNVPMQSGLRCPGQKLMWKIGDLIGDKEGRLDICVACAGVLKPDIDCLEYPADVFQQVCPL